MDTTSPSKKTMRMNNQENRMVREKNCNNVMFEINIPMDNKDAASSMPSAEPPSGCDEAISKCSDMAQDQDQLPCQHKMLNKCTQHVAHAPPAMVLFFLNPCVRADSRCRAVQARLCRKSCGHVIGLGPYLLSMTSSPFALVAVTGFSSFHFRFVPLISAPFAICRWLPFTQLLFRHWTITVA